MRPTPSFIDIVPGNENGCAKCLWECFPGRFRYVGQNRWEWFDEQNKEWGEDVGRKRISACIAVELYGRLLARANEWQQHSQSCPSDHEGNFYFRHLMSLTRKLQCKAFIASVIREAKEWYDPSR